MGGKKKYIEMFGSFMEPFNYDTTTPLDKSSSLISQRLGLTSLSTYCRSYHRQVFPVTLLLTTKPAKPIKTNNKHNKKLSHRRQTDAFRGQSRSPNMVPFHTLCMDSF